MSLKEKLELKYKIVNDKILFNWSFKLLVVLLAILAVVISWIVYVNSFKDTVDFENDTQESWKVLERVLETHETTVPGFNVIQDGNIISVSKQKDALANKLGIEPKVSFVALENGESIYYRNYFDATAYSRAYMINMAVYQVIIFTISVFFTYFSVMLIVTVYDLILWFRINRICDRQMKEIQSKKESPNLS